MRRLILIALLLILPSLARAADFSLPLEGNYRTGRYMPVRITAAAGEIRIFADGAVTTIIQNPIGGIVPFLIVRSPLQDSPFSQPLHELAADEKLIGFAADAPDLAAALFPGAKIVSIALDPANPLPGPTMAWQSLDALVLDSPTALTDPVKSVLLAGGTTLAVRSTGPAPPDADNSWRLDHGFWILQSPPGLSAAVNDDAYLPISGWQVGRTAAYRRHITLIGGIFAILIIGAAMWRSPWAAPLGFAIAVAAIVAIPIWDSFVLPVVAAQGTIQINSADGSPAVADTWVFQRAAKAIQYRLPIGGLALPILPAHGGPEQMSLLCAANGNPLFFRYHLDTGRPAAFVFRGLTHLSSPDAALTTPVTSPLRLLLPQYYSGLTAMGETPLDPDAQIVDMTQWPTLTLANSDAIPKNDSGSPPAALPLPSTRDSSNR